MFNNTSRILSYGSGQTTAVILPHSEKILTSKDLDKKIARLKGHIQYLTAQLPQRISHGGKGFRKEKIILQDLISQAGDRIKLLERANDIIKKVQLQTSKQAIPGLKTTSTPSRSFSHLNRPHS